MDSPPETARVILPGIKEDPSSQLQSPSTPLPQMTPITLTDKEEQSLKDALKSSLIASAPPRIDISRASSSSQHEDSITSSPERENGTNNLGYKEDGKIFNQSKIFGISANGKIITYKRAETKTIYP